MLNGRKTEDSVRIEGMERLEVQASYQNRSLYVGKTIKLSEDKNELEEDTRIRDICAGDNARSSIQRMP